MVLKRFFIIQLQPLHRPGQAASSSGVALSSVAGEGGGCPALKHWFLLLEKSPNAYIRLAQLVSVRIGLQIFQALYVHWIDK